MEKGYTKRKPLAEENRKYWKMVVFGILTFGIYDILYMWDLVKDLNLVCSRQETENSRNEEDSGDRTNAANSPNYLIVLLLSVCTLSIYGFIWWYKQGERLKTASEKYGLETKEGGRTYLLWKTVGLLIIIGPAYGTYLFVRNLNKAAKAYNYQVRKGLSPEGIPPAGVPDGQSTTGRIDLGMIVGIEGYFKGKIFEAASGISYVIGRNSAESHIVIPDRSVSKLHCIVRFSSDDRCYYLTDKSTYGTFMNGTARFEKDKEEKVPMGSRISLGDSGNEFLLR